MGIRDEFALSKAASLGEGTSVTVLGSGGGPAVWKRNGPSVAVTCNGSAYLVDFGLGVLRQYRRAGLSHAALRAAFVTHLHSDHIAELFMYFAASMYHSSRRVPLYGPASAGAGNLPGVAERRISTDDPAPGLHETMRRMRLAYAYDQNIRIGDEGATDIFGDGDDALVEVHELRNPEGGSIDVVDPPMDPFEVYGDENVRVTAIAVRHPPVFPTWAYRFDSADGSIVISADTAPCDNLVRIARGADLLIHEVVNVDAMKDYFAQASAPDELLAHMYKAHTSDRTLEIGDAVFEGVGSIAQRAGIGELILTHLVPTVDWTDAEGWVEIAEDEWLDGPRSEFTGPVRLARELDVITLPRRA